jgi:YHS domain-containing protein
MMLSLVLITFAFGFASSTPAADDRRPAVAEYNLPADHIAIQGYSPVSYFESGKAEKGDANFAVSYRGVTYHLTSAKQVETFNANPAKYEPAYGGWCAYGAAISKKFPIDPTNFKIVDGRLMLFLKNESVDALAKWNQADESKQVHQADQFWRGLTKE